MKITPSVFALTFLALSLLSVQSASSERRVVKKVETNVPFVTTESGNSTYAPTSEPTASFRVLKEGPKGGCYYNNSNDNKVYVDRDLC